MGSCVERQHRKIGPERANKAIARCEINDLTQKTKPIQSQFKASKSFRSDGRSQNKAKAKLLSPLDSRCVKKQSQSRLPWPAAAHHHFTVDVDGG